MLGLFAGVMLHATVMSAEASIPFYSGELLPTEAHSGWYQLEGLRYVGPAHREAFARYVALAEQVSREPSADAAFASIYRYLMELEQPVRGGPSYLGVTLDWMQRHPDIYGPLLFRRKGQLPEFINHPTYYAGVLKRTLPDIAARNRAVGIEEDSWANVEVAMKGVLRTCLACHN